MGQIFYFGTYDNVPSPTAPVKRTGIEVTTCGAVPSRPSASHFHKDTGPDHENIAGTPPGKGAESGAVGWGPSAGAERPIIL